MAESSPVDTTASGWCRPSHPVRDGLALLVGALLPLAFAPFDYWPLAILLPAVLLGLWQGVTPWRAAWRGGLFGLGAYSTGIYWIYISLHQYGNAPAVFAVLATLVVIVVMALYPAAVGYLLAHWGPLPGPGRYLLVAPALWALLEWVRSWLFTGFPWLALGYSQLDSPLAGLAPYLGVFAVGWAVLVTAGALWLLLTGDRRGRWLAVSTVVLLWGTAWGLAQREWVSPAGPPLRVSLVQGNISQDRKWRIEHWETTLRRYAELSRGVVDRSDVIIWPETAIPMLYPDAEPFVAGLIEQAQEHGFDYLIGVPSGSWETRVLHNSVVSLGRTAGFYHKHRLLPFGEYVPLRWLLNVFHRFVDIPMADFTAGAADQPLLQAGGQPVGVSICFEAVFGSEIRAGLPAARWLVNVSNDAWFGDSLAPHQHLQIVQMRALETGRYVARATNTGVTAIMDARGRIVARLPQFSAEVLAGEVQPLAGATPYVRLGDGVAVLWFSLLLVLGLVRSWRRQGEAAGQRLDAGPP